MRSRGYLWIGGALILIGLLSIASIIFKFELHGSGWAILLIVLGILLLLRPRAISGQGLDSFRIFGDAHRRGEWTVQSEGFWAFLGDVYLDLTAATLQDGETVIHSGCFIGSVRVHAPADMAVSISSIGFITDARLFDEKRDSFIAPIEIATPNYASAARKVRIETFYFIGGVKVRKV